ncbi:hypothetical protein GCM10010965_15140 [Caldalkalibacillus thermarum]|nr:hypothetical protein GCM10010965_15140 [Caldalkalibacillus thermarum]
MFDHQALIEKSKQYLWLPFTQMKDYDQHPLIIASGERVRLTDTQGNPIMTAFHLCGSMCTDTAKQNWMKRSESSLSSLLTLLCWA